MLENARKKLLQVERDRSDTKAAVDELEEELVETERKCNSLSVELAQANEAYASLKKSVQDIKIKKKRDLTRFTFETPKSKQDLRGNEQ